MVEAVDAELGGVLVGERPADVVVAAHVVDPRAAVGMLCRRSSAWASIREVAGRERLPRQRHLQRVVRELALAGSMYWATSSGCTIASDLNSSDGAAIRRPR